MTSISREPALKNQLSFRQSNMLELEGRSDPVEPVEVVCECAWLGCGKRIPTTVGDYLAAHARPNRFVVVPGHEIPKFEEIVEWSDGYVVIEKLSHSR